MKLLTAWAMREADRVTMEEMGFPGIALMENAGMRVAEAVLSMKPLPARVVVLAGPGNNGGDGLVAARHLSSAGLCVSLWCTCEPGAYRGDAGINISFLVHRGYTIKHILEEKDLDRVKADLAGAHLVIDALLGTGIQRPVQGLMESLINAINTGNAPVLSVDVPSGINADTGQVQGAAVKARWTVTLAYPKRGLVLFPGAEYAGRVTVADIHIPEKAVKQEGLEVPTLEEVAEWLPPRPRQGHKGTFGRILVVAGSPGMTGAAVMAAESALRGGGGLVYLASARSLRPVLESKLMEVITLGLAESGEGILSPAAAGEVLELAQGCQVVAVGPGLLPGDDTYRFLESLIPDCPVPMVLDAGALGALSGRAPLLRKARAPVVVTPHAGEMSRLTGLTLPEVESERMELPLKFAREWGAGVVLKGAPTVCASPGGEVTRVNPTGGPNLATAGTGDLLTGLISALIAQGMSPEKAAPAGVFIHGLAADLAPTRGRGLKAGDILLSFPAAFRALERGLGEPSLFGPFQRDLRPHFPTGEE